jgi:hypothetical protein
MRRDKGKPSGVNKSEGTGTPSNVNDSGQKKDKGLSRDTEETAPHIKHPNRNVDKGNATNIDGYRS